ncbi:MAG: DUF2911 domain-containing protein, partial [Gemmatimonadaceae bacterium]
ASVLQLVNPTEGGAQVRASERGVVSQTIDGTVFTIDYARPRVRGRDGLFGRVVTWGEVWTPGANWATTLEVTRDVRIDGHQVPKGKYSVWMIVGPQEWTVVLDPRNKRYHTETPDSTAEQVRWVVRPQEGAFTESLTWSFPEVTPGGTQLLFQWETKRVVLNARVTPKHPLTIARAEVEPYLGRYRWSFVEDTSTKMMMELYYENGSLKARYEPDPDFYRAMQRSIMARINDDWFIPALMKNGEIWEMVADMVFEFDVKNGKATGFEIRDDRDILLGSGKRVESP